tara:strand:+ start:375 stop:1064 length:690 start_codon:yes stop_codon:yes gene_type:complete
MKIVIVKKTGVLGELDWKKNVDLDSIYKKCGFRKNKDFGKRHTWKISDEQYVSLYSKDNGRANTENKYELPPPIDSPLYFGSLAIVKHTETEPTNTNCIDLTGEEWKKIRENLMGGFEDLDEEEEESEEEYVDPKDLTKQGYKKDGFVVEDGDMEFNSDSEEEEWIPSQEENTEDSLEDADDDEEEELEAHLASSSVEEEEEEEEESDEEIPEMAGDSNDELKEEEYEY